MTQKHKKIIASAAILLLIGAIAAFSLLRSHTPPRPIDYYDNPDVREQVPCPDKDDAIVMAVFGQSNSANYALFRTADTSGHILNFFEGKCSLAKDPLLGTDGYRGSIWITLAQKMAEETGKKVVIQAFGAGGTPIARWATEDDLGKYLKSELYTLKYTYPDIDYVFWVQGEADIYTPLPQYQQFMDILLAYIRSFYPDVTFGLSSTTYCDSRKSDELAKFQESMASEEKNIVWLGNMDQFIGQEYRWDNCHLTTKGVEAVTDEFMKHLFP